MPNPTRRATDRGRCVRSHLGGGTKTGESPQGFERALLDDVGGLLHLRARDDERRDETQDVTLTSGDGQQTARATRRDERGGGAVELHADEQARAANLAKTRVTGELFGERRLQLVPAFGDVG